MMIGYARVSRKDQQLELQLNALAKAGCEKIFSDKMSGSRADRQGLERALEMLRPGDTLVVWKLDRLGRTVRQLVNLVHELQEMGVNFLSLTDGINTGTPAGRFFFHMMSALAQMERELIQERTNAGLEIARKMGRKGGRKTKMTPAKLKSARLLLAGGTAPQAVADQLGVSVPTLYRHIPRGVATAAVDEAEDENVTK